MAENLWGDVAAAYDRSFATLCAGTTSELVARIAPGSDVLDVGCGSGHLTAALVAAGHRVAAADPDPQMVQLTRGRAGVAAAVAGLPDLAGVPAADVVVANFVLNHVDHPRAAAAGLTSVVRPGGRVLATIWPGAPAPHGVLWNQLLDQAGALRPTMPRLSAELDYERSPEGLAGLLEGAGLGVVHAGTRAWTWRVAPDAYWVGVTSIGNFGVTWQAQPEEVRERMRTAYDSGIRSWLDDGLLAFDVECVLVEAVGAGG